MKVYKPYTPSRRFITTEDFSDITTNKPEKKLTTFLWKTGWRNNQWRITTRFRWGWHKRLYRMVDFRGYDKLNVPAKVVSIEYDPYRTSRIVLVSYKDWEKRYQIAWKWVKVGDIIESGDSAIVKPGYRKQLKNIPDWFSIFNLEFTPMTKGKIVRSAWESAIITWRDEVKKLVFVKMPSGEVRLFNENCYATIWQVSNEDHKNMVIWKAGRNRWLWRKPQVLWKSMNPVDHPHGWWEWHTDIWLKYPKAFNGRPVPPGKKTRKSSKVSSRFIVSRRKK